MSHCFALFRFNRNILLFSHLYTASILRKCQYGLTGINDAVFKIINDVYTARDIGEYLLACFLDLWKAFDSIHHLELIAIPPLPFKQTLRLPPKQDPASDLYLSL